MKHTTILRLLHISRAFIIVITGSKRLKKSCYLHKTIGMFLVIVSCCTHLLASTGGLPAQFLVSDEWHNLFTSHSPVTNPSFITSEDYPSLRSAAAFSSNGIGNLFEVGYIQPIGLLQSAALTLITESGSPVQNDSLVSLSSMYDSIVSAGLSSNSNILFMLTYAVNIWNGLSVGTNMKLLIQTNFGDPVTGFSSDFGIDYNLLEDPLWGNHKAGVMIQNALAIGGSKNSSKALKCALHSTFLEERITLDYNIDITDIFTKSSLFINGKKVNGLNMECVLGLYPFHLFQIMPYIGLAKGGLDFWGTGLGLCLLPLNKGHDLSFTYQYRNSMKKEITAMHSLYARAEFGRHREDVHEMKIKQKLNLLPNDLYIKAMELYQSKKYWDAYLIFSKLYYGFPDFFKNDLVLYHMSLCLEELDMRNAAIDNVNEIKALFPLSKILPYAQLEAMRLLYRQQKYSEIADQYQEILSAGIHDNYTKMSDSLKFHATYIMGQVMLNKNKHADAAKYLSSIPEYHPDYPFAQHSLAVISIIKDNKNYKTAMDYLSNAVVTKPRNEGERDLSDRSYLFAGYLYYEQEILGNAVATLMAIPKTSTYYFEAQLGLGWSAIKGKQWKDCITFGKAASDGSKSPLISAEGRLIAACGYIINKEYLTAETQIKEAEQSLKDYNRILDSLTIEKDQYGIDRQNYDILGTRLAGFAKKGESSTMESELQLIHTAQERQKSKIDKYSTFADMCNRMAMFGSNTTKLKEDIDYARARIGMMNANKGNLKEVEKSKKAENSVQDEIDKAKRELEKLQNDSQ